MQNCAELETVFSLSATYHNKVCTGDLRAAQYVMEAHLVSCSTMAVDNASETARASAAVCDSCIWDLMDSLVVAYYRLAEATDFFATEDVMASVLPKVSCFG